MRKISLRINLMFIVLILVLVSVFSTFLIAFAVKDINAKEINSQFVSDYTVVDNPDGIYKMFSNGSTYLFTDKDKIDGYRAGTESSDLTQITVNSSKTHGSQENPYVIDSVEGWTLFANDMTANYGNSNYAASKYYVLAADLDFKGSTAPFIRNYAGTFYGLGHVITNVVYDCYEDWNNYYFGGLFTCLVQEAVITDLSVIGYQTSSPGGLIGYTESHKGDNGAIPDTMYILNCHTDGEIDSSGHFSFHGGILGFNWSDAVVIYRCSANVRGYINTSPTNNSGIGGIVGSSFDVYYPSNRITWNNTLKIYDCYADVEGWCESNGKEEVFCGALGGIIGSNELVVENFVGKCHIKNLNPYAYASGAFMTCYRAKTGLGSTWTLKDIYVTAEYEHSDGIYKPYFAPARNDYLSSFSGTMTATNTHYTSDPSADKSYSDYGKATEMVTGFTEESCTPEELLQNAKDDGVFQDKIWDKSQIGTKDVVEKSPVRNYKICELDLKYRNYTKSGSTEKFDPVEGANDILTHGGGLKLAIPTNPEENHDFVGWTLDKTGKGEIYTELPRYVYGNQTLYAVWDVVDTKTIETNVTSDKTEIEYGTGKIRVQGTINLADMKTPSRIYRWYQDGELVQEGSASFIERNTVKQSGKYELKYTIWDDSEPLWRHSGSASQSVTINITKGKLSVKDFSIAKETPAYFGKPLKDINFNITAVDSNGKEVTGSASWLYETTKVQKGENKDIEIHFVPNDSDNYETCGVSNSLKVSFMSEFVKLIFNIKDLHGDFSVDMEYNQNYSANNIRELFKTGYQKFLDEHPGAQTGAENMTPKLNGVAVNDFDQTIEHIVDNVTIEVTLEEDTYTVTFDERNGKDTTEKIFYYGNRIIPKPAQPQNSGQVFLGWFWDKPVADSDPVSTEWDFDKDVVTSNMTLYAKWLDVKFVFDRLEIDASHEFTALDTIMDGDLKIIAHLISEDGKYTQELELAWGDYKIEYPTTDEKLHYDNPSIIIQYKYGTSAPVRETVNLTVNKKEVDTTALKFTNKSFAADGKLHKLVVQGTWPPEIKNITYEYFNGTQSLGSDGVSEFGTYNVTATFETINSDYYAKAMNATLTITRGAEEVVVKWGSANFTYNGKEQHPTVQIFDKDEIEITENMSFDFVYVDGSDGISAGSHTIKIVSDDTGYTLTGQVECTYSISKKQLSDPTLDGEITYNGQEQFVADYLKDYDPKAMLLSGDIKGTFAGDYRVTITLTDKKNYTWDKTSATISWKIQKLHLTADWDAFEFLHDNSEHSPRVKGLIGIIESDLEQIDFENDFVYTLPPQINVGSYTTMVEFNSDAEWTENYILEGNIEWSYVIVPKKGMTIITIEWTNTELVYNRAIQCPTFIVKDKDGNDITEIVKKQLVLGGDYKTSKWEGDYEINATLSDSNGKYFIRQGATCKYHISADENGGGSITDPEHPDNPNNTDNPDKPNEDNGFKLPENFPLWQFIAGGIALILSIAFLTKAGTNDSKRRKFKSKTKAVQKSYSIVATPLIVMAASYLGLEQNIWTILACIMIGFCVVGFALMLGTGHALKKAEAGYETALEEKKAAEDAKIAERNAEIERKREEEQQKRDEEQRRRDEEQRKRDEEMKMMFMAMMNKQGSSGDGNGYASVPIEEIVAKTVAAIMPSMQTLMITDHSSVDNETMTKLLEQQEKLIAKLMEHQSIAATANQFIDDDEDEDDEEMSWDDEEDEEEVDEITPVEMVTPTGEVVVTEATVKKVIKLPANFRARLKMSSDKNREAYVSLKNLLCSKRGLTFRVCGRVEKVKYKGELIAVIGVATKHIKLWLALDPTAFDKRRYFHKDVSDKIRYAQVPMLFKISSERALDRAFELVDALCEKFDIETKRKYTEKSLQVLAYTLKHNAILKLKKTEILCESIHVHDTDIMNNDEVSECIERRGIEAIEEENFATIKLDDIDKNFVDGQKVTLDALKRKELVDENCNGFKVVAGTRLTKPLIIMANEFTISAVKMIVLTGGRAILLVQQNQ